MKNYFKNFAALALSVLLVAGITACNNEFESGNINEAPKGQIILDNDFVTIRMVNNEVRAITEQVPYTKEDWAYNTTEVIYDGVSATTEFYSKNSSINVECKKEGIYIFKSTAYKTDKKTVIATSDYVTKNVTFANGDFDLIITYTNIESYEVTTGVTGAIENQWGEEEEKTAVLSKDWISTTSRNGIKSISFIKTAYTGPFTKTWPGGENITVYYNANDESLVVSAAGLTIYAPEDSRFLFSYFSSAESIDLSNLNTSKVTDMGAMFNYCSNLTTLDVSNFDTSNVRSMSSMFSFCSNLSNLDVNNFVTSNVTDMSCMFQGLEKLTSLDVSNFDTSNVRYINNMFGGCEKLTTLDVSNFDTSNVTDMGWMFRTCLSLTTLDLSSFDTSNVTNICHMFYRCESLTTINLRDFDTSNVTDMSGMFSYCKKLTSLDVSNFDTSNVTNMASMFRDCNNLTTLDLSNFDTSNVTDMSEMFANGTSLTTLDLSSFATSNVTNTRSMFTGCWNNLKVTYNPTTWTIGTTNWSKVTFVAK